MHPPLLLPSWSQSLWIGDPQAPCIGLAESAGRNAQDLIAAAYLCCGHFVRDGDLAFRLFDDRRDADTGANCAHQAVAQGVSAVVGHFSSPVAVAAARIYRQWQLPFFSPSASADTLQGSDLAPTFAIYPKDRDLVRMLARFLTDSGNAACIHGQLGNNGEHLAVALADVLGQMSEQVKVHATDEAIVVDTSIKADDARTVVFLGSAEFSRSKLGEPLPKHVKAAVVSDDLKGAPYLDAAQAKFGIPVYVFSAVLAEHAVNGPWTRDTVGAAEDLLGRAPGPYFEITAFLLDLIAPHIMNFRPNACELRDVLCSQVLNSPLGVIQFGKDGTANGPRWSIEACNRHIR